MTCQTIQPRFESILYNLLQFSQKNCLHKHSNKNDLASFFFFCFCVLLTVSIKLTILFITYGQGRFRVGMNNEMYLSQMNPNYSIMILIGRVIRVLS